MIETKEITMSSKKIFSTLFLLYGTPWSLAAFAGCILFVALGGFVNPRFFIIALIWVFLFIPLLTAFLYFFYGLKPLTAFNTIPHLISISDNTLMVKIISPKNENENEDLSTPYSDTKEIIHSLQLSDLSGCRSTKDGIILDFNTKGWLWLPAEYYADFSDYIKTFNSFEQTPSPQKI